MPRAVWTVWGHWAGECLSHVTILHHLHKGQRPASHCTSSCYQCCKVLRTSTNKSLEDKVHTRVLFVLSFNCWGVFFYEYWGASPRGICGFQYICSFFCFTFKHTWKTDVLVDWTIVWMHFIVPNIWHHMPSIGRVNSTRFGVDVRTALLDELATRFRFSADCLGGSVLQS